MLKMRVILGVALFITLFIDNGLSLSKSTSTSKPTDAETTKKPIDTKEDGDNSSYNIDASLSAFDKKQLNTEPSSPGYFLKMPIFITVPTLVSVADDIPISTEIFRVKAVDPDMKKQRKVAYRFFTRSFNQIFYVDSVTGAVTTKARLDTGTLPKWNVSKYTITIVAEFQNETRDGLYGETIDDESPWSFVVVTIYALRGGFRDLLHQPDIEPVPVPTTVPASTEPVVKSFWDADFWLNIEIVIISVIDGVLLGILIVGILVNIYDWMQQRIVTPPPSKCVQVVAETKF